MAEIKITKCKSCGGKHRYFSGKCGKHKVRRRSRKGNGRSIESDKRRQHVKRREYKIR